MRSYSRSSPSHTPTASNKIIRSDILIVKIDPTARSSCCFSSCLTTTYQRCERQAKVTNREASHLAKQNSLQCHRKVPTDGTATNRIQAGTAAAGTAVPVVVVGMPRLNTAVEGTGRRRTRHPRPPAEPTAEEEGTTPRTGRKSRGAIRYVSPWLRESNDHHGERFLVIHSSVVVSRFP